jgi:hypothetical protein
VRPVLYALAAIVALLGLIFLIGNQGLVQRIVVGIVLIAAGVALSWLATVKAPQPTVKITQDIDLPGDAELEQLKCRSCGATLDEKSIELREGAIFVKCAYCGTSYQIEEAPKW